MSEYFGSALAAVNTTLVTPFVQHVQEVHGRQRIARSEITFLLQTTDTARMLTLKSTDRLYELWLCGNGAGSAGATDVGIYTAGELHAGAVVDQDFFGSAIASPSTAAGADVFAEATAANTVLRGLPMWQIAGASSDPGGYYDIALDPTTHFASTAPRMVMIAHYLAGD
tara:strand:- start:34 stop:540 length:507 start_codon:yes stop_codon:yes gene_type:complete